MTYDTLRLSPLQIQTRTLVDGITTMQTLQVVHHIPLAAAPLHLQQVGHLLVL